MNRFICVFLIILFSGCFSRPQGLDTQVDDFQIVENHLAQNIREQIKSSVRSLKTFRALYELSLEKDGKSEFFKQTVAFKYPDKFRLELFSTNLNTLTVLVTAESNLMQGVDLVKKEGFRGIVSRENTEKLLLVPIELSQMMMIFGAQLDVGNSNVEVRERSGLELGSFQYLVSGDYNDDQRFRALFNLTGEKNLVLKRLEIYKNDNIELRIDYAYAENKTTPERILLSLSKADLLATLTAQQVEVNADFMRIADRLFKLRIPDNMKINELD